MKMKYKHWHGVATSAIQGKHDKLKYIYIQNSWNDEDLKYVKAYRINLVYFNKKTIQIWEIFTVDD